MKCNVCGLEMELYQSIVMDGQLVKRYRCTCGNEQADFIKREAQAEKPRKPDKPIEKWD